MHVSPDARDEPDIDACPSEGSGVPGPRVTCTNMVTVPNAAVADCLRLGRLGRIPTTDTEGTSRDRARWVPTSRERMLSAGGCDRDRPHRRCSTCRLASVGSDSPGGVTP